MNCNYCHQLCWYCWNCTCFWSREGGWWRQICEGCATGLRFRSWRGETVQERYVTHWTLNTALFPPCVVEGGKPGIHVGQFLTAIADNLKAHLSDANSDLVSHVQVLDPALWPNNDSRLLYGEQSVVTLAKPLKLQCSPTAEQFRKLTDGKQRESHIKKFITAAATYPETSAECVGFQLWMTLPETSEMHSMTQTVSDLMFLAVNKPPLEKFEPLPHVRSWLEQGRPKSITWGCLGHTVPVIWTGVMTLLVCCCVSRLWT